eukprot:GHRR01003749.1.p1 GENE.GHRR01003749.1~~GHRR01003749.1.p1  ORF type:complete len:162 (+),score=36.49 GHRR01003749.1:210-695(+)
MATGTSRNILITVDDSPASERVFGYALQNFYRPGDVLHILHILPPSRQVVVTPDLGLEGVLEDNEDTRRKVDDHARQFLKDKFETKLETLKIPYQLDIMRGPDADNSSIGVLVCKRAEQLNAVVVVMAKHSRGPIQEWFIGSATNYACHHCKQPVLVLHCD